MSPSALLFYAIGGDSVPFTVIAADASSSDPVSNLLTYGPLGIFAAIMAVVIRALLKREQERSDKAEAQVLALNTRIQEQVIPAVVQSTQATQAAMAILQAIQYKQDVEKAAKGE